MQQLLLGLRQENGVGVVFLEQLNADLGIGSWVVLVCDIICKMEDVSACANQPQMSVTLAHNLQEKQTFGALQVFRYVGRKRGPLSIIIHVITKKGIVVVFI